MSSSAANTSHTVTAVLFDYGLVLTGPPDPAAWQALMRVFQVEEQPFHEAYWHYRLDYDRGVLDAEAYWSSVADRLGRALSNSELHELKAADTLLWTAPNQPMIDWAARLQQAGIKTGILSNLGDAMEAGILARCGWLADFAHHTFSHRLHLAKPEAGIYRHAAEGLQTAPSAILFIDDREDNIQGAITAGMQAIRYIDHASFLLAMRERSFDYLLNL